ncbi:glycosyl hydrolase 53 family protein [Lentzea sp. BCCO 10_0798]|uniref:Arabinogalactan endo-beta-1,4-galactanase n=1 Tax=Lentzea kristufekii TaxID=3095430 RepID=A0ABU4U8U0_9PSEU|nr:glycosyl hydrolase 53 family protein [Lentzea sp. BCCO 10_0798]MDX8056775.1 glycosyl hydrolase 53 family protein [Lentzea sp. BCCO 10_0798]
MTGISRRSLMIGAAAGAGALALGTTSQASAATFVKGADISWMPQMEANGYYWLNKSGVRQDLFTILKSYGLTAISLRTWVNPSNSPANGHCSIQETVKMAQRCRDAGMQVLLGFHFGDTWNSVGVQKPPKAWANMSYPQMRDALRRYVDDSLKLLKAGGVTPGWVKIGNEQNSGICSPVGSVSKPSQMTGLLNAAYDVSKQVFPATPVMVHLAQPQKMDSIQRFFNAYRGNGGKWDITGLSSYAQGSNVAPIIGNMRTIQSTYGKPIMHVEYGGPIGNPNQVRDGLKQFITGTKAFGGLGTFFWEPEGYSPFSGYDMTAWESNRRPTAAMDGFLNV